ncbi:MAG TPA: sugar phosphate isomerase/epimerase [Gemmatimonadaceae bacterium]|jgi:sugar phosphate isomerase/epimerase
MPVSRREFVASIGVASIGAMLSRSVRRYPLGLEPGLQLWSVGRELNNDTPGTLRELSRIGFRELELFELPSAPREFRSQCNDLGLSLVGGHFYLQSLADAKTLQAAHVLGLKYIIVVFPTLRSIKDKDISNMSVKELTPLYEKITLDDYRWNAEQFNRYGEQLARDGLQLGYHNHAVDLKQLDGRIALEVLIENTDPRLVVFEMDTGHVIHAGKDPTQYLEKYPTRIQLLHLKDLKPGFGISARLDTEEMDTNAELGSGVIDWRRFFAIAARGNVKHWFIEHEGKMDNSHMTAVARSLRFLQQFQ